MNEFERNATKQFALYMEQQRWERNISQADMAKLLGISASSYKKIVAGHTDKIPLHLIIRMHHMTNAMLWEMIKDGPTNDLELYYSMYRLLDMEDQDIIKAMIRSLSNKKKDR